MGGSATAVSTGNFQRHFAAGGHDFLNIFPMALGTFRGFIVSGKNQPFKFFPAFSAFKLIDGHLVPVSWIYKIFQPA
jgi:hypothetical protein